ncbi:MAG: hemerythrin domain-containing protein [Chloroflexi bacterium]|nr:MAG: hemerythrin domain-containing protein [Chloroflexota bacterium]
MEQKITPNIARSLFTIHAVITRGLQVSLEYTGKIQSDPQLGNQYRAGFADYVHSLASVLHSHHLVEDDLTFPYLRDKLPDAPYDLIASQHQEMIPFIEELEKSIESWKTGNDVELEKMQSFLKSINDLWHPHIQLEEEFFTIEKLDGCIPPDEQMEKIKEAAAHSQKNSGPPFLVIPFILFNLPEPARSGMKKAMPSEVVEQLVPVTWKQNWEPMQPFLLN